MNTNSKDSSLSENRNDSGEDWLLPLTHSIEEEMRLQALEEQCHRGALPPKKFAHDLTGRKHEKGGSHGESRRGRRRGRRTGKEMHEVEETKLRRGQTHVSAEGEGVERDAKADAA